MGDFKTSEILALSVEQRLELVERVWDTLVDTPEQIPVPSWHIDAIDQALTARERDANSGSSWEEVKERIARRLSTYPITFLFNANR